MPTEAPQSTLAAISIYINHAIHKKKAGPSRLTVSFEINRFQASYEFSLIKKIKKKPRTNKNQAGTFPVEGSRLTGHHIGASGRQRCPFPSAEPSTTQQSTEGAALSHLLLLLSPFAKAVALSGGAGDNSFPRRSMAKPMLYSARTGVMHTRR